MTINKVDWCCGDESDPRLDECGNTLLTFSLMYGTRNPREIALATYRDYYHGGGYDTERLSWTLDAFLPSSNGGKVLEIGCGDGAMLRLPAERNFDAVGVDASASGIDRCAARGLALTVLISAQMGCHSPMIPSIWQQSQRPLSGPLSRHRQTHPARHCLLFQSFK